MEQHHKILLFWGMCALLTFAYLIIQHENTHDAISRSHGCINSTVVYFAWEPHQVCNEYSPFASKELWQQEFNLHMQNEIVSYNLQTLLFAIFALGTLLIILADYIKKE
jgi:hypothetical protein